MPDGHATTTRAAYIVSEREKWLRRHLPGLEVGRTHTGIWHVLSVRHGDPLCFVGQLSASRQGIEEIGPLESASPGKLCKHCARMQGDTYAEW